MQEIKISTAKIITGVITTLVAGALIGAFTVVRVSDSNTIRVTAVELDLGTIKEDYVSKREIDQLKNHFDTRFDSMEELIKLQK